MQYLEGFDDDVFDDAPFDAGGECAECGGSGFLEDCCSCQAVETTCNCLEPDPPPCPACGGTGEG